ncbi:Rrf2 family transcriptional regulator [Lactonifactor longoviformis]|uniref:Transcriptional regulator, BadM/Rrf2 family n=1 Tax=Lactonifactor longoviformis DSM 17459 TaxID=1122155 RepID=A0A1M4YSY9_9CLOT|nr:Rrf2 family transcriptional regulator [Lactonifactor longoviformis]POP31358.1 Rrf2 family transcriptional regulator [Lactonifactor longoviformis]SHF08885.1 transcriptional regulator, BadM/Rrf2 family [Lactonifactor longoviformis DSM 17459]
MKISAKGRYALRLMIDLAEHNSGEYIPLKEISRRQEISVKYLEQIVVILGKAGYLRSTRGPQGGYMLAKDPGQYTAGDILRLIEGKLAPVACLEDETNQCLRQEACATLKFWEGLYRVINEYVDSVTLQDLAEEHRKSGALDFII